MTTDNSNIFNPWEDSKNKPFLEIKDINKSYDGVKALTDVSVNIYQKEFFALLGPSGCGKSTLLRMLAGFETTDSGQLLLEGNDIVQTPINKRPINMMFQSYALFPHMTVEENIAFGLKQEKLPKQNIKQRTDEVIEMVQLGAFAKRKPNKLSGGQQQRTALARSLVKRPKLLLLDEPLGALDKKLREETQFELVDLQEKLAMTFIIVTHDQEEAMTMATRIAVMNQGKIIQVDTPMKIYEYPQTNFVAHFIGDVNIFAGKLKQRENDFLEIVCPNDNATFKTKNSPKHHRHLALGDSVNYAIRPEKINIEKINSNAKKDNTVLNSITGKIIDIGYLGNRSAYHVELDSKKVIIASLNNSVRKEFMTLSWDDEVFLTWESASSVLLTK